MYRGGAIFMKKIISKFRYIKNSLTFAVLKINIVNVDFKHCSFK